MFYVSHIGLLHWKQADLCCLKKKCACTVKTLCLFLLLLWCPFVKHVKDYDNYPDKVILSDIKIKDFHIYGLIVWLLGARVKNSQSKWVERERKQIPHCPANKPIVKQRIIYLGQLAKWYK